MKVKVIQGDYVGAESEIYNVLLIDEKSGFFLLWINNSWKNIDIIHCAPAEDGTTEEFAELKLKDKVSYGVKSLAGYCSTCGKRLY